MVIEIAWKKGTQTTEQCFELWLFSLKLSVIACVPGEGTERGTISVCAVLL